MGTDTRDGESDESIGGRIAGVIIGILVVGLCSAAIGFDNLSYYGEGIQGGLTFSIIDGFETFASVAGDFEEYFLPLNVDLQIRQCGWSGLYYCASAGITSTTPCKDRKKVDLMSFNYNDEIPLGCNPSRSLCQQGCAFVAASGGALIGFDVQACNRDCVIRNPSCRTFAGGLSWFVFTILAITSAISSSLCFVCGKCKSCTSPGFVLSTLFITLALMTWYFVNVVRPYGICPNSSDASIAVGDTRLAVGVSNWLLVVAGVLSIIGSFIGCCF